MYRLNRDTFPVKPILPGQQGSKGIPPGTPASMATPVKVEMFWDWEELLMV